ncbi:MAG: hypothetical protein JWM58_2634 [Rhizobium sp.]|nr:hypothetical protein [Rhizobium sp.]
MFDPIDFDPATAGLWPTGTARLEAYGTGREPDLDAKVHAVWLETKAASEPPPAEQSQQLLNEMTVELRQQFEAFRKIRVDAEAKLVTGDDGEVKLAKADIKSANDALSLIVRTIEKIDSLQRSLAHDREIAVERDFDEASYEALLVGINRKIEDRARELAEQRLGLQGAAPGTGAGPPGRQPATEVPTEIEKGA